MSACLQKGFWFTSQNDIFTARARVELEDLQSNDAAFPTHESIREPAANWFAPVGYLKLDRRAANKQLRRSRSRTWSGFRPSGLSGSVRGVPVGEAKGFARTDKLSV